MPADPQRLGRYVKARREELGLSQDEVAARGGPSDTTLGKIEGGAGGLSRISVAKLDQPLSWAPGSARRVLEGGEPEPVGTTATPHPRDLSYEDLWKRWAELFAESLVLEIEYASRRGLEPGEARDELWGVFVMAQRSREGHAWSPPWEHSDHADAD